MQRSAFTGPMLNPRVCLPSHRWLWLAAQHPHWRAEEHTCYPPAFRQAARALLLVAHRGASLAGPSAGSSGAAQLRRLPRELLPAILA